MNKLIATISLLSIGFGFGLAFIQLQFVDFEDLPLDQMYAQVLSQRDKAIDKAMDHGDYRCCVSPGCTMCYMEGNAWNNNTAGTCACADFIAKGEKPCPQCLRLLSQVDVKLE